MSKTIGSLCEVGEELLSVEWQIEDFFSKSGNSYTSPGFTFSDSDWHLKIYPHGKTEDKSDSIALYLCNADMYPSEAVTFTAGLKNADATVYLKRNLTWKFRANSGYGWRSILARSELMRRKLELAPSDILTVTCCLKNLPSTEMNTLSSNFKDLLVSKKNCDVTIKVKNKTFSAHKVIMAARSPVFASMFEHDMSENNSGSVNIEDCDPDSFQDFLHYIYTGRSDLTARNVFHLYRNSDKYCMDELKSYCKAFMMENLTVDNVCYDLVLAHQYRDSELTCCAVNFFQVNVKDVLLSSKWLSFLQENSRLADQLLKYIAPKIRIENSDY